MVNVEINRWIEKKNKQIKITKWIKYAIVGSMCVMFVHTLPLFLYEHERYATRFCNCNGNAHGSHMLKFNCFTNVKTRKCTYGFSIKLTFANNKQQAVTTSYEHNNSNAVSICDGVCQISTWINWYEWKKHINNNNNN